MLPWRLILAKASHSPNQGFRERLAGKARAACNFYLSPGSEYHQSSTGSTPLSEQGHFVSHFKSRGVLRFDGSDMVKYLQRLVTSDLTPFEDPPSDARLSVRMPNQPEAFRGPIYATLLTPQGRFLYDLFIYRPIKAEEKFDRTGSGPGRQSHQPALLADMDIHLLDELLDHLKKELSSVSRFGARVWQRG